MKKLSLSALFLLGALWINAQRINNNGRAFFREKEDSLKNFSSKIIQAADGEDRFLADSFFTKIFVRTLIKNNSFYYPFDSLETISKLYAPDSSFRIFTWQMVVSENMVRQHGAIQMRTNDGSLKLFPLIDKSDVVINLADTLANNKGWIGAVYYKIIETKTDGRNYYTLLGYDENNIRSNRKVIEVLNFNNEEPFFGGRYFSFNEDSVSRPAISRYIMEYKKDAGARLVYDNDLSMIVYEHLESETNEPGKKWTYIPDGDYEGFKWKNGKWVHVNKVFTLITPEGKEPVPNPVKDAAGKTMEDKLQNNIPVEQVTGDVPAPPKTKPVKKRKLE